MSNELIDTHQHLWVMSERAYSWIAPEYGPLYDDFTPKDLLLKFRHLVLLDQSWCKQQTPMKILSIC